MADQDPPLAEETPPPPATILALLGLAAIVGLGVALASWGFLELVNQIQIGIFTDLPKDLGYVHGAPLWWPLPVYGLGGALVAAAVVLLPGTGGHVPAYG